MLIEFEGSRGSPVIILAEHITGIEQAHEYVILRLLTGNFLVVKGTLQEVREKWEKALRRSQPKMMWPRRCVGL